LAAARTILLGQNGRYFRRSVRHKRNDLDPAHQPIEFLSTLFRLVQQITARFGRNILVGHQNMAIRKQFAQ